MSFQTAVYSRQAPGLAGDFASDNPRDFYPAGPGGLVAGASGVTIGNFAWVSPSHIDWDSGGTDLNSFGTGPVSGIVHRQQVGQITTFLAEAGLVIPAGNIVSLLTGGDVWLKNSAATLAQSGMKAYAAFLTGAVTFGWTGAPTASASATTASIAAGTAATSALSTISGNVLTTGASVSNTIYPGAIVTGGTVASGTYIVSQLSGVTGGAGTYAVSIPEQTVTSATLTFTPSVYTPGTMQAGTVAVGAIIIASGGGYTTTAATTGTIAGMSVMAAVSSTTWSLAPASGLTAAGTLTSGTIVTASNVETKWYAVSSGAQNEVVRCSSHALG
jgi:hypothetical protein